MDDRALSLEAEKKRKMSQQDEEFIEVQMRNAHPKW